MSNKKTKQAKEKRNKNTVKSSYSSDGRKVVWVFDKIDKSGDYAFDINREDFNHKLFLDKLLSYSTMTWTDIKNQKHDDNKSKHHNYPFEKMSNSAQKRFEKLDLDEYSDNIFSFALTSKLRIVGFRENEKFYVLWYDDNHQIYPSAKKHT